nr:MAG TPA: hypothetical protein [Bacteriophage sp.]
MCEMSVLCLIFGSCLTAIPNHLASLLPLINPFYYLN